MLCLGSLHRAPRVCSHWDLSHHNLLTIPGPSKLQCTIREVSMCNVINVINNKIQYVHISIIYICIIMNTYQYSKPCSVGFWVQFSSPNHSRALPGRHHPLKSGLDGAKPFLFCVWLCCSKTGRSGHRDKQKNGLDSQQISMSFIQHLSIPTMDCRCSAIAFVTLPAVVSLHLKLCELVCSKVTKCQTQLETYPTGTSSVALHLKFSFQNQKESTRRAAKVLGCSMSGVYRYCIINNFLTNISGVPTTPRRNPVLLTQQYWQLHNAQDIFVLYRERKEETNTQSRM